jgi:hypothetical protein
MSTHLLGGTRKASNMAPFFNLACTTYPRLARSSAQAPQDAGQGIDGGTAVEAQIADLIRPHALRRYRYLSRGPDRRVYRYC